MRYDDGYSRDYGRMPRYDAMFRGRERHMGPPQGRRGRDAGRMGWRDLGPGTHPGWQEHPLPGETDFLGRPYPRQAMDDRPWGLMDQEDRQARYAGPAGYDRGDYFRGYDRGYDRGGFGAGRRYGMDYGRPGDMRYTSNWTRWF